MALWCHLRSDDLRACHFNSVSHNEQSLCYEYFPRQTEFQFAQSHTFICIWISLLYLYGVNRPTLQNCSCPNIWKWCVMMLKCVICGRTDRDMYCLVYMCVVPCSQYRMSCLFMQASCLASWSPSLENQSLEETGRPLWPSSHVHTYSPHRHVPLH